MSAVSTEFFKPKSGYAKINIVNLLKRLQQILLSDHVKGKLYKHVNSIVEVPFNESDEFNKYRYISMAGYLVTCLLDKEKSLTPIEKEIYTICRDLALWVHRKFKADGLSDADIVTMSVVGCSYEEFQARQILKSSVTEAADVVTGPTETSSSEQQAAIHLSQDFDDSEDEFEYFGDDERLELGNDEILDHALASSTPIYAPAIKAR